jgi:acyl-CoA reductase-like NAD-dependent aldehyde dehydrogenase
MRVTKPTRFQSPKRICAICIFNLCELRIMSDFPSRPFIDGEYKSPGGDKRIRLINPANDEAIGDVQAADVPEVNSAVESAHRAWKQSWRDLSPGKRTEILFNVSKQIRANAAELAHAEMTNIGKPLADARDEIALGARVFEYYAGAVTKFYGQTIPVARGGFDFTLRQSMGVVAAIVPWNFPFPIACWKVAPALAAGNTVVLKPASLSPLTALMLGKIAVDAGLPPGVLQVLPGSGAKMGDALVTHALVRKISFTGSTEIGSRIMELASKSIKRISLELGGKSPNIVFADADLEKAAAQSPGSVFANTGQDCCARTRVFVERRIYKEFVDRFIAATKELKVDDPAKESTQIGPMVSAQQRDSVEEYIANARGAGRQIAYGGARPFQKGAFLQPTVITEPQTQDRVWREEIFGPVACIRPFDSEEQLIEEVNDTPYGLSGSIWTNDLRRAIRISRQVESGVLSINCNNSVHVEAPFGGFKQSGIGRDLGMNALEGYTELKNVYVAE